MIQLGGKYCTVSSSNFWVPMRIRIIKMCLNEMYSKVCTRRHLSDNLSIHNGLKQDALLPLIFNFALEYVIRKVQKDQVGLKWKTSAAGLC
jgi:hypothetical protein